MATNLGNKKSAGKKVEVEAEMDVEMGAGMGSEVPGPVPVPDLGRELVDQNFDWENSTWDVVDSFFKQDNILIKHHIDSFDHFISYQLENIIHEKEFQLRVNNKATYNAEKDMYGETYIVEFGRVSIAKPVLQDAPNKPMFPSEARIRKLTYSSGIYVDIHHKTVITDFSSNPIKVREIIHPEIPRFSLGKMPIMVGSKFCILSEQSNMTKVEMGEGEYDLGGYFIVKGSEKVIVNHERKCENRVYCFKQKAGGKSIEEVSMKSVHPDTPKNISSIFIKMKAKEEVLGGHVLRFRVKKLRQDLPLVIIFRALGYESDREITELIAYDIENEANTPIMDLFKASIEESKPIQTQEEALEYISKYIMGLPVSKFKDNKCKLRYTFEILCNELFPNVGLNPIKKAYYLGYMVNKMFKCHLGILPYDDRDSYMNKRIDTSGELMAQLFRDYFGRFFKDLKSACEKEMIQTQGATGVNGIMELSKNLANKLKPNDIESGIKFALSTGNWGLKSSSQMKKGVAQVLQRVSYLGTMSNLRRIVSDLDKNVKQTEPRQLHNTQYGLICPFETPEGANIGIIKNMSLTAYVTIPSDSTMVTNCLDELGVKALDSLRPYDIAYSVKVFVNGDWYGQSFDPYNLTMRLRAMRRNGAINIYTSISWHIQKNEIHIWSDSGRLCRPLYIVRNNKINITDEYVAEMKEKGYTWKDMLTRPIQQKMRASPAAIAEEVEEGGEDCHCADYDDSGAILEYLDVEEIDTCMVAMTIHNLELNNRKNESFYNYTHCEIHPSMMLGVLTSNIPFAEHNPAPRNMFQAAQCKQAMGIYTTAFQKRMDTLSYILHYPQRSLVNTINSKYLHSEDIPAGQMAIVAIACYMGYNQEDSLIFNQSSVERGLYNSSIYKTYMDEEKKNLTTLEEEKFCRPEKFYANGETKTEKMGAGNYEKLDVDGFVKVGSKVDGNDIIIGKVVPIKGAVEGKAKFRDASTQLAETESGIIDMVYKNRNGDGYMFAKIRVKSDRDPELGDKFSCLLPNAEVLTTTGWKEIKDVTLDDKVAILDPATDSLIYEKPQQTHIYDFNDKMYKLTSDQVDLTVTPNHRMWVNVRRTRVIDGKSVEYPDGYNFLTADKCFGRRLKYKKNAKNYVPEKWIGESFVIPAYKDRPEITVNMSDWLVFFGIWLAEGWSDSNQVSFAVNKDRVQTALKPVIDSMGFKISSNDNKWRICNVQLAAYMEQYSVGAVNKKMPEWVWDLNQQQSQLLLSSMELGDGYHSKSNTRLYSTSSKQLADDYCRLAMHAGYSTHSRVNNGREAGRVSYYGDEGRTITSTSDNYTITIIKSKCEPMINHGHHKTQSGQREEWVDYNGKVHCLTVSTGIFLVRENGKPVWTGNSRHGQKGTIGMTLRQEDMPYTKDGVVPDVIMTPHALPKRMTIGQFIECIFGKVGIMAGTEFDATPFRKVEIEKISDIMEKFGFSGAGTEVMYNGKSGKQMDTKIFIGPVFYHRLKHLSREKIHGRATGPYQLLVRQPAEGRSRGRHNCL